MITLEKAEKEFKTNANDCGLHLFCMVKRGVNPQGNSVYIYSRAPILSEDAGSYKLGRIFGFEVFIPKVLKAGTVQKFPGGKEVTIAEDTEVYPNGAKTDFGKRAWFCSSLDSAEKRFLDLMSKGAAEPEGDDEDDAPKVTKPAKASPEIAKIPTGEFSCKELAAANNVEFPVASVWLKERVNIGKIKKTRTERRSPRGPETQLYVLAMS